MRVPPGDSLILQGSYALPYFYYRRFSFGEVISGPKKTGGGGTPSSAFPEKLLLESHSK
jgi:hypothetical protein